MKKIDLKRCYFLLNEDGSCKFVVKLPDPELETLQMHVEKLFDEDATPLPTKERAYGEKLADEIGIK